MAFALVLHKLVALVLHKLAKAAFSATAAFAPLTDNHQNHSGEKQRSLRGSIFWL